MDRQRASLRAPDAMGRLGRQAGKLARTPTFRVVADFLAGFALAFAAMGSGIAPFGLSYVAMRPGGGLAAAAGAFGGYTLAYGAGGLTYAAAVLICFACRLVLGDTRLGRTPYLMPLCAFGSLLCVKSVVALESGLTGVLLLVCEAVLCGGFCLLFGTALREAGPSMRTGVLWGRLALLAAALLVFQPIRVLGDVAPARVIAGFAVMSVACFGGSALGAAAGVALGACMDLAAGLGPFFAAAYGFAGLVGGIGGQRGRFVSAIGYVMANCVATLWGFSHPAAMPGLFECFIASVAFAMLPDSAYERLGGLVEQREAAGQRAFAVGRLEAIGAAIGELGATLDGLIQGRRRQNGDISRVYDRAAERVCRRCPLAAVCWDRDYMTTQTVLNDVTQQLRRHNFVREEDFPGHFAERCIQFKQLCGAINEEYRAFLRRAAALRREEESQALMSRQYQSLQGVISDMAGAAGNFPEYFPQLEARVRTIAKAYCRPHRVGVYSLGGRMHVEISLSGEGNTLSDSEAFMRSLSLGLKRRFWPPEAVSAQNGIILRISQRERLTATVGCSVRKKQGEAVSGDTTAHLHTDDGRAVVLLSDGMGTGSAAGAMSGRALQLIAGFVNSGCGLAESARAVLPVLAARFEQNGFVTLDLLEINLFTGDAQFIKYGASPSYVLRGERAEKIAGQALPAGLGAAGEAPRPQTVRLAGGDRVVMMSDGVWENSDTERLLGEAARQESGQLGRQLIEAAARAGAVDDMSVLVIGVAEN